ncbi:MAG: hypothetical protein QOF48_126 [Verrucomicrobiota bacterium]
MDGWGVGCSNGVRIEPRNCSIASYCTGAPRDGDKGELDRESIGDQRQWRAESDRCKTIADAGSRRSKPAVDERGWQTGNGAGRQPATGIRQSRIYKYHWRSGIYLEAGSGDPAAPPNTAVVHECERRNGCGLECSDQPRSRRHQSTHRCGLSAGSSHPLDTHFGTERNSAALSCWGSGFTNRERHNPSRRRNTAPGR